MEFVGLALAIPGIIDLCLKYGRSLVDKFQSYKNAHQQLAELIKRFRFNWNNLDKGIAFFKRIQHRLDDETRLQFHELVQSIHGKLLKIHLKVESASNDRDSIIVKIKFALLLKSSLLDAINEFEIWHKLLLDFIFLLTRTSDSVIEREINDEPTGNTGSEAVSRVQKLRKAIKLDGKGTGDSIFLSPDDDFWNGRIFVRHTSIATKKLPGEEGTVLIDSIPSSIGYHNERGALEEDVENLAVVLREVDPMIFGIPVCKGIVRVQDAAGELIKLEMVFKVPKQLQNPRSLRSLFLSQNEPEYAINERIHLAKRLARTVLFVHSANFVHKNFHPETIIIFDALDTPDDQEYSRKIGTPLLVGFQKIRLATGRSLKRGDTKWNKNLYRHPTRQGLYPDETYRMQHDIYSLGVCLLEIALWKSFVLWDEQGEIPSMSAESELLLKDIKSPHEVKRRLIEMAREMIPRSLGHQYTEVTIACLTCLDKNNELGNASEFLGEDGISIGVRYMAKILGKLEEIHV